MVDVILPAIEGVEWVAWITEDALADCRERVEGASRNLKLGGSAVSKLDTRG